MPAAQTAPSSFLHCRACFVRVAMRAAASLAVLFAAFAARAQSEQTMLIGRTGGAPHAGFAPAAAKPKTCCDNARATCCDQTFAPPLEYACPEVSCCDAACEAVTLETVVARRAASRRSCARTSSARVPARVGPAGGVARAERPRPEAVRGLLRRVSRGRVRLPRGLWRRLRVRAARGRKMGTLQGNLNVSV